MKSLTMWVLAGILAGGMTVAPSAVAGETGHRTTKKVHYEHGYYYYYSGGRYYKLRSGWYALNYPYYWGYGPAVGDSDPYDFSGHYFSSPSHQRR